MKSGSYKTQKLYFTQRLLEKLDGIREYPLTVVEAPMGYGKTTAVKAVMQKIDASVFWLKVYTGSVETFWNGFADLFRDLDQRCAEHLSKLGAPDDAISVSEGLQLIGGLTLSRKSIFVIDDYHLIDSPEIDGFLEILAESEIENLHIVLNTRFSNLQRMDELALKGLLHHITQESFELHPEDIAAYYKTCGIMITNDQAEQLFSTTDGWISALYLMMLEYIADGNWEPPDNIYTLIEKAVYFSLSDEVKECIVAMSILDQFTLPQAQYISGNKNAATLLNEIINKNAFVNYDSRTKTYHIHSLYKEYLRGVVAQKEKSDMDDLYRKAAQWYMDNHDCLNARRYFYACGDFDGALLALEQDRSNDFTAENKEQLKTYMEACPRESMLRHPNARLIYALHLFVHGELCAFHQICGQFSADIDAQEDLPPDMRNRLLGELELLLSFAEFNDLKKMSVRHKKAWQLLQQPTSIYDTGVNWAFGSPSILSLYYRESGMLQEHIAYIKESTPYYYRLTNGHGAGAEYAMEAESLFNQGDFENAEISLQKAMLKAQSAGEDTIAACVLYLRTLVAFMKGDLPDVMQRIDEIHGARDQINGYQSIHMMEIGEGCIYAYLDQRDKIPENLLEIDICNPKRLQFPALVFFYVMYGRVLLISGDYEKLIGSADHFFSVSSVYQNLMGYVYTYIYLAAAYGKLSREEEARSSLIKALEIAMPDKQYMLFVENCDYIAPLLRTLSSRGFFTEDIERILSLYETYARSKEEIIRMYFSGSGPSLTEREMDVSRLVAEGLTNSEIAQRLYISINTVKALLKTIYAKLSINNRIRLKQYVDTLSED